MHVREKLGDLKELLQKAALLPALPISHRRMPTHCVLDQSTKGFQFAQGESYLFCEYLASPHRICSLAF